MSVGYLLALAVFGVIPLALLAVAGVLVLLASDSCHHDDTGAR